MSLKRKLTLGAAGALALTGAGAAVAAASGHSPGHVKTPAARSSSTSISSLLGRAGHVGRPGMGPGDDFAAAATYLGITTAQLQSDLQSGKTLAQVADAAAGKSSAGLVAALVAHEQTEIAAAVTAGKLTQAQADQVTANLQQRFTDMVDGTRPAGPGPGFGRPGVGPGDDFAAAATYLGITTSALQSDLQSGKTLAQVADATAGKSSAGLVAALVTHEKTEVAAAVTAGKLTQAQADQITANLEQRETDMVNGTLPKRGDGPHGGWQGGPPPSGGATFWGGTNA